MKSVESNSNILKVERRRLGASAVLTVGLAAAAFMMWGAVRPHKSYVDAGNIIPGHFIVTLRDNVSPEAVAEGYGIRPHFVYHSAFAGFSAQLSENERIALYADPRVLTIEPDGVVSATDTEVNPQWGLDRIDQRFLPLDSSYTYNKTGQGVTVYMLDSGIRATHIDFGGRVSFGFDAYGGHGETCNEHGTSNAGIVGGTTYGVAKGVSMVSVKVLDCSGSSPLSAVIAGVDWVIAHHVSPAVANMSIGYYPATSTSLDVAVQQMITSGVTTVVAAGNNNVDACGDTPARVSDAITVGNVNSSDVRDSTSNFGPCVDFFAPGVNIPSDGVDSDTATFVGNGTSKSAPFASGVAALYLQSYPTATPMQVRDALLSFTTKGVVTNANTPNNHLLYSLEAVGGTGDFVSPTTSITSPANGGTVAKHSTTTINATALDNVGVTKVEFYVDGVLQCTDTSTPYSCSWKVPNTHGETFLLQSKAYDTYGNVGSGALISVTD
jgi:subtilisin family serine protease